MWERAAHTLPLARVRTDPTHYRQGQYAVGERIWGVTIVLVRQANLLQILMLYASFTLYRQISQKFLRAARAGKF